MAAEPTEFVSERSESEHGCMSAKAADLVDQRTADFLGRCSAALTDAATEPESIEGAAALQEALQQSTPRSFAAGWLPVLEDTIGLVDEQTLGRSFTELAPSLPWTTTKRATDAGADFALSPLNQVRDFGDVMVGIMYVRPGRQYPLHNHSPQELYLTISGQADWRFGGHEQFQPVGPGQTLYNHPNDLHSAIAGPTPLVALYVLWS